MGEVEQEACCGFTCASSTEGIAARFYLLFQAEDGIRYLTVTGVQTCALPILCGAVMGTGDTPTMLPLLLVLAVAMLGSAYGAGPLLGMPLEAVWASEIVGWAACLALCYALLRGGRWNRVAI